MLAFFKSLASNMQKMTFLYQAAGTYIQNAYNTMYYNEQQPVVWEHWEKPLTSRCL